MGVKGLWRLLLPIGRRISIETLTGKVLAVDASIWLTQFVKAMRDPTTGKVATAAHLIGFFRRLCKLRFHGIKPIFVFDGATPEIKRREVLMRRKRREQFATLTDGSVQRLAKKLLSETLKKQQKQLDNSKKAPDKGGAFAPGFNPGGQSASRVAKTASAEDRNSSEEEVGNKEPVAAAVGKSPEQEDQPEVEIIDDVLPKEQDVSDWDLPLQVAAAEEAKELDDASTDGSASTVVEYDDCNDFSTNDFAIERVSELSAVQRKDAIEKARRAQRLQSRKEFMPAAANPMDFSAVQLRNFLKHCKLNKDIQQAAKVAGERENAGQGGEFMASDRTTRVELIREDEEISASVESKEVQGRQNINKPQRRLVAKQSRDDSSDEDETSWCDPIPQKHHLSPKKRKHRAIQDDDDSDESVVAVAKSKILCARDTDSSDEAGGGGFLPTSKAPTEAGASKPSVAAPVLLGLQHADSEDDGSEGGGFLTVDQKQVTAISTSDKQKDFTVAQEFEDHALAVALQEQEIERDEEESSNMQQGDVAESEDRALALALQRSADQELPVDGSSRGADSSAEPYQTRREVIDIAESSDEDDVQWEDGECDDAEGEADGAFERPIENAADSFNELDGGDDHQNASVTATRCTYVVGGGDDDAVFSSDPWSGSPSSKKRITTDANQSINDQTSAALLHAQATAANLTNWAGRAFRRAIKEVGGQDDIDSRKAPAAETLETFGVHADHHIGAETNTSAKSSTGMRNVNRQVAGTESGSDGSLCNEGNLQEEIVPIGDDEPEHKVHVAQPVRPGEISAVETFDQVAILENEAQWAAERNRRERDMDTISDEMLEEAKQLLQLFGVPYIEAPAEAEAQCAALEQLGLVDGVVTEDSDVFVFGGSIVYKNIFEEQKYAEVYKAADAEREMNLGHNAMIALAMLLGSDYTEGVKGVGIVNAMEVLSAFDVSNDLKAGLFSFKKWLDGFDPADVLGDGVGAEAVKRSDFHSKHKSARTRWIAPQSFPSDAVMKAYKDPVVDKSLEAFSWGVPDTENLILFCNQHIGWLPDDTKKLLDPVVQSMKGGMRQTRIDSFMKYEDSIKFADVRSKRLREVLGLRSDDEKQNEKSDEAM